VLCAVFVARRAAAETEAWGSLLGWLDGPTAASNTLTLLALSEVVARKHREQAQEAAAEGAAESGGAEALRFEIAHKDMEVGAEGGRWRSVEVEGGRWRSVVTKTTGFDGNYRCAAGPALGPAGVHWAEFVNESENGDSMYFGLILDGWDVAGGRDAEDVDGHCFFSTGSGGRYPGNHEDWPGSEDATAKGDRIGMRLDLGAGSLTVFKNGALLGVMQGTGLEGRAYRWAVSLGHSRSMRLAAPSAASVAAMEAAVEE
jgi:hypothetical protein